MNNEYTIGVDEGILDIPEDFAPVCSEETCLYYQVELRFSNFAVSQ
ncbi:MAG: hypothetical protein LUG98_00990 [Tannerellaceae bacterium]|nr:hypothetical protein [Tannerellaceae bacterium]